MSGLDRLREVAEAATPGPWIIEDYDRVHRDLRDDVGALVAQAHGEYVPNAQHIAAFDPPMVLALLDVAEAATHTVDEQDWTGPAVDVLLRNALDRLAEVLS